MELDHCINFLLNAAQNKVFQYFSQQLSLYHITPAQYGVLNCLWNHGQLTPKQIGEMLALEASSISGILDRMQKSGLIERNIHPDNRRTIIVTATHKAQSMRHDIEAIVVDINNKFLASFTEQERHLLANCLKTIINSN